MGACKSLLAPRWAAARSDENAATARDREPANARWRQDYLNRLGINKDQQAAKLQKPQPLVHSDATAPVGLPRVTSLPDVFFHTPLPEMQRVSSLPAMPLRFIGEG